MTRSSPSSYDEDFFAWTQDQAAALRAAQAGAAGGLDFAHLAQEVEDLGKRDLRDVTSNLSRLFEHLIKIANAPSARESAHWHGEALGFQIDAVEAFSPSMRRLIDLAPLWQRGRRQAEATLTQLGIDMRAPPICPFEVDELLSETFEVRNALGRLARPEA